ncbi:MAG TPA: hypothetical protein VGQ89_12515 [Candidatus Limnocylindrales bacterium]|nr:hypothetical protein [Candidatus Limnocylindrales bacterium]
MRSCYDEPVDSRDRRRRRLEAELRVARRHVETIERTLQTLRAD